MTQQELEIMWERNNGGCSSRKAAAAKTLCFFLLLFLGAGSGLGQVTDQPPDEVVISILLQLMRPQPPGSAWTADVQDNYLKQYGFTPAEIGKVRDAAVAYFREAEPLDQQLCAANDRFRGRNDQPEALSAVAPILAQKTALTYRALDDLKFGMGAESTRKLEAHIAMMKQKIRRTPIRQAQSVHEHGGR